MNNLQITPPEGFEIDIKKSDLSKGLVFFKEVPKVLTYADVAKKLFHKKSCYFLASNGVVTPAERRSDAFIETATNCARHAQGASILALNKLMNIAEYFRKDWVPYIGDAKYFIEPIFGDRGGYEYYKIKKHVSVQYGLVYFESEVIAKEVARIMGSDLVNALVLNH